MSEPKRPLKVFLCHASTDKPKVRELYRYLKRRGIQPWFDEEHLVGGQDWQVEIPKALATSDAIIICLTKNSVDKEGYIQREIKFALEKALEMPEGKIFLIPVKFEECEVPLSLSRYQWVDLTIESGYAKMMKALKFRASQLERSMVEVSKKDVEQENLAREKKEREAAEKTAREKAEHDATEKARLEAEEQTRQKAVKEKAERELAEKVAREKTERESAEKAERERIAKEILEKAEQQAAEKVALEKAEREVAEQTARDKVKKLDERARLEGEKRIKEKNAKKQADKESIEKVLLEAEKQESFKIDETYTKIKPWIAYWGAISIGLFTGVFFILITAIPVVTGINSPSFPFEYLLFIFNIIVGIWLVITRRLLAFFLSYIVWFLLVLLAEIIRNKSAVPLDIALLAFSIYGFLGLFINFFLLKISVMKKLFSRILLCCAVCVIWLFVVFLGSDTMLGFFDAPLESSYGFLPYIFVYFLFFSFLGNWLRRVFKNRLPNLFAEN